MPAVRNTYVNPLMTNISKGYGNNKLIADQVFPTVIVEKETGTYFVVDAERENLRDPVDVKRGELSRANRVTNKLTSATYALEEKELETYISDRVMKNYSSPFEPKRNATNLVTSKLAINKESDLHSTLKAAVTPTDLAGAWTTTSTDIIGTIRTGRDTILKNTGEEANVLILSKEAFDLVLENDDVVERVKYTARASEQVITSAISDFFGVDKILIGKGVKNTADEGQTASLSYIWEDDVALMYVSPTPAIENPSAGYHLQLRDARYVDEWYEEDVKATFVRANDFYDAKVIDTNAIKFYEDAKTT